MYKSTGEGRYRSIDSVKLLKLVDQRGLELASSCAWALFSIHGDELWLCTILAIEASHRLRILFGASVDICGLKSREKHAILFRRPVGKSSAKAAECERRFGRRSCQGRCRLAG